MPGGVTPISLTLKVPTSPPAQVAGGGVTAGGGVAVGAGVGVEHTIVPGTI